MATACRSDGTLPGVPQRRLDLPGGDHVYRPTAPAAPLARRSPRVVGSALVALTKPRIIELLLVTTVPAMLLAQHGVPPLRLRNELELGFKQVKWIEAIEFVETFATSAGDKAASTRTTNFMATACPSDTTPSATLEPQSASSPCSVSE